jgi:hypothetical protein
MSGITEAMERLGIGLSRLLRYFYGGFLLVGFISILNPDLAKSVRDAMSWQLVTIAAVVLGTGVYAIHRHAIVPIHHAVMCLACAVIGKFEGTSISDSKNPVLWLRSLKVDRLCCIPAYTALRRCGVFDKDKDEWDVAHAESGLVLMTAEAFLIAGLWAMLQSTSNVSPTLLFVVGSILLLASYSGWVQHAIECRCFRLDEQRVRETLTQLRFLKPES